MIAALAADELERAGVAAFRPAVHDAGRLAPQVRGSAVAGLASKREGRASVGVKAQPQVTGMARSARYRGGTRTARQLVTGHAGVSGVLRRRPGRPFHPLLSPSVPRPLVVIA